MISDAMRNSVCWVRQVVRRVFTRRRQAVAESTACGNCGELLAEPANTPVEKRQPCPKCGSTRRNFPVVTTESLPSFTETVITWVTTYPKALLTIAQKLIDQELFNIAIVTSHMACE